MIPGLVLDAAWDNRLFVDAGTAAGSLGALPSTAPAPFRIWQAGGELGRSRRLVDYDELDRASLTWESDRGRLCAGRQAVGWGRGTVFSAVDIFSPFTPLEIDREWRRGVDALSADLKLTKTSSVGVVAAAGPDWRSSAVGGRVRGYLGPADAELLVAKRAEDGMCGATGSMAVGGAEVHAEAAVFHTPGDLPITGIGGRRDMIPKALLGVSDNFDVGSGLRAALEYHWSGFGAARPSGIPALLASPSFAARLARGDTQLTGRQAVACTAGYDLTALWSLNLEVLGSLIDPSAVLALSMSWNASDSVTVIATGYAGVHAAGGTRGQFGAVPRALLLQCRWYL
jgi:hypothetical protein